VTYKMTTGELIDRLAIVTLKRIRIPEHRAGYDEEIAMLKSEIPDGEVIHAVIVNALANVAIWDNESMVREGRDQDLHLLKRTHSLNGVRTRAKNRINELTGERQDVKLDCLAEREMEEWPKLGGA